MPEMDADHLLAALAVLVPLLGGTVLLWQRTTAGLKESAAWRARVEARLDQMERRLSKLDKLNDCVQDIRITLAGMKKHLNGDRR